MKRLRKDEKGIAMLVALAILAILLALSAVLIFNAYTMWGTVRERKTVQSAEVNASSLLDYMSSALQNDSNGFGKYVYGEIKGDISNWFDGKNEGWPWTEPGKTPTGKQLKTTTYTKTDGENTIKTEIEMYWINEKTRMDTYHKEKGKHCTASADSYIWNYFNDNWHKGNKPSIKLVINIRSEVNGTVQNLSRTFDLNVTRQFLFPGYIYDWTWLY